MLVGLVVVSPQSQVPIEHLPSRRISQAIAALVSFANAVSLGLLIHYLLHHDVSNGEQLIVSGAIIWLTNVLIFSLWYWELDRGGPSVRAAGHDGPPDFLFPQMSDDRWYPGLATDVHRLPVRIADQRDGLQPDRHDAAQCLRQGHHGAAVRGLAGDGRSRRRPGGQHPRLASCGSAGARPITALDTLKV